MGAGQGFFSWQESLATVVELTGALVTSAALFQGARTFWRRTIGRRRHAARKIRQLAPQYRIEFYESILGQAAVTWRADSGGETFTEWIWIDPLFFVQAVTGERDGSVLRWAVTSREKNFRPRLVLLPGTERPVRLRLNSSAFTDLYEHEPQEIFCSVGARRYWYWEKHWFGNPGLYKHFFQGINSAGWSSGSEVERLIAMQGAVEAHDYSAEVIRRFRKTEPLNTYGETAVAWRGDPFDIGPDADMVRIVADWGVRDRVARRVGDWVSRNILRRRSE